jgi:iron complex outermembrane recepter protein
VNLVPRNLVLCATGTVLLAIVSLAPRPASAQRADDNAVTSAGDAFGATVGSQTIGLYGPTNVRGFNPAQAENLRIEGLYYDQQITYSNPFLFSRSDIRVGIAAQSYNFPSPTGVVDYKLRLPGDEPHTSALLTLGPLTMRTAEIDAQGPLVKDHLSVAVAVARWDNFDYNYARTSGSLGLSVLMRIRPRSQSEIVPFIGYSNNGEHEELPSVYDSGPMQPPIYDEQKLVAQQWSSWGWNQLTAGIIARSAIGRTWKLTAGVFRSSAQNSQNFNDLMIGLTGTGVARHIMDVSPPLTRASYSGDLRLTRTSGGAIHERELVLDARGRNAVRYFGGDAILDLGPTSVYRIPSIPSPRLVFSELSEDTVRQVGVGISYSERWNGAGSVSVGVLATEYRRTLNRPGVSANASRVSTVLPTVSGTAALGRRATAFASYTRGLEDSVNAPNSAINRGEPVPATVTWQVDGGVRIEPSAGLQVLIGAFEIHKPYFDVDAAGRYGLHGDISSVGVEGSATLSGTDGLTIVAGFVLLKPEVKQRPDGSLDTSIVPVGPVPRTIITHLPNGVVGPPAFN